jgi:hypothetical protein
VSYLIAAYGVTGVALVAYSVYLVRERVRARESRPRARETNNG